MKYLDEILDLPAEERIQIAEAIWASLEDDERPISRELEDELQRRLANAEAHPETIRSWDEVKSELFGRK